MSKKFPARVAIVQEYENGDLYFELPPEIVEHLGHKEGDALVFERTNKPGRFIIRKPKGKPPYEQPTEPSSS